MKISACMIAKNEEKVIARCIESYRASVDEIIVVDTGSTDQTVAIAKSLGARVYHFTWIDDFAAAKNYAISKAKGDWIVFLDADEYFSEDTARNIRKLLEEIVNRHDTIICKLINIDNDGTYVDQIMQMRIFKNHRHIRYSNAIHERLSHMITNKKLSAYLAEPNQLLIYHTGYSTDSRQEKAQRNLKILLQEVADAANNPMIYQYISDCYFGLEKWEDALEYAELFLKSGVKFVGYNLKPYQNIIESMQHLRYSDSDIMVRITQAIDKFQHHPLPHFYRANVLFGLMKYDQAFDEYKKCIALQKAYTDLETNSVPAVLQYIFFRLGVISEHRNKMEETMDYYVRSLKVSNQTEVCFDRMMMIVRSQPDHEIIAFLNSIYNMDNEVHLDFLVTRLVNHAAPRVFAYYTSLQEKRYSKQDIIVLQMLVANRHYDKAFSSLLDFYIQDGDERLAVLTATAAALGGNKVYIMKCMEHLPPSYGKVLQAYEGETRIFTDEDKSAFLSLVHTFILWADDNEVNKLLGLRNSFPYGMAIELGHLFIREGYYSMALQSFTEATEKRSVELDTVAYMTIYYNQGYCLHRLQRYDEAGLVFIKAYECGYRSNDIYEFLRWGLKKIDASSPVGIRIAEILQAAAKH